MKVLLLYPPFATPATPPYSIAHLYSYLRGNLGADSEHQIDCLDLNVLFHKKRFDKYFSLLKTKKDYDKNSEAYLEVSREVYAKNNKAVIEGKKPELFEELFEEISKRKPDLVALSLVYSSQNFYAHSLLAELKARGIKTVVGGPAAPKLLESYASVISDEPQELLRMIDPKIAAPREFPIDFSAFQKKDYFASELVIPIKTAESCYYQRCAFCSHHGKKKYCEIPLPLIEKTIQESGAKHFFLIDDMIHKKRLLDIGEVMRKNGAKWVCQLKPTKDLDFETLKTLRDCGLRIVIWGVESGNNRVLALMAKATNKEDIERVLADSKKAGIQNVVYIMFGFPSETKAEFLETIDFLKTNSENIDLVSTSIFGLQKDTEAYDNPKKFSIAKITENKRTILEPTIEYTVTSGLSQKEAKELRRNYAKTLAKLNKLPKTYNFFREHMLLHLEQKD